MASRPYDGALIVLTGITQWDNAGGSWTSKKFYQKRAAIVTLLGRRRMEMEMEMIEDTVVPTNSGRSFIVRQGKVIRILAESVVDLVTFNLDNLQERFDQARTKANQDKIFVSVNDILFSKLNNPMMTILEDTYKGKHDLQYGMCSKWRYDQLWEKRNTGEWKNFFMKLEVQKREDLPDHGCLENLIDSLREYGISGEDIPSPFNMFQNMRVDGTTGKLTWWVDPCRPEPGRPAQMTLRADMNCLVAISACPEMGKGKSVRVQILI